MSKREGSKGGNDLEHDLETWLQMRGWVVHRAAAVRVGRFSRKHDLFECLDFLAFGGPWGLRDTKPATRTGYTWGIQATVPDKRSARRKKVVATGPWPLSWRVSVVTHESERVGRDTWHWFLVEDYDSVAGTWSAQERVRVNMQEILEYRSNKAALERAAAAQAAREAGAK